ncbi:MAG: hypothetical protein F6K26_30685 [Moorea sp. SIO2I5]|nr:hypothetical protein [Moorena sp. SIO2I5]
MFDIPKLQNVSNRLLLTSDVSIQLSAVSSQRSAVSQRLTLGLWPRCANVNSRQQSGTGHNRCDFTEIKQMVTCFIQKHHL